MTFAQMYSAVSHIFPKENIKDKIKSIKFQDMNIQTHSINKRERWIIQVVTFLIPESLDSLIFEGTRYNHSK